MVHDRRKANHIRINLEEEVQFPRLTNGFERYRLVHQALPELDLMAVDTSVELLGKRLKVPLLISPMTGEQACALSGAEVKALAPGQAQLAEARARLTGYCQTLQQRYGEHLRLRSYTVVSLGFDRLAWKEV